MSVSHACVSITGRWETPYRIETPWPLSRAERADRYLTFGAVWFPEIRSWPTSGGPTAFSSCADSLPLTALSFTRAHPAVHHLSVA